MRRWWASRLWPWLVVAGFLALLVAGYLRPELGAEREIRLAMSVLGLGRPAAQLLVIGLRKLGHLAGYAALALALLSGLRRPGLSPGRRAAWALLLAAGVALADEFVQSRIPWRAGLVSDVLLDVVAAALAVGLARARSGENSQREREES